MVMNGLSKMSLPIALLAMCLVSEGCQGTQDTGVAASGSVQSDDKPLSGAIITLEPIGTTTGPNASASILDGRFKIEPSAGLHGGTYRVRISMMPSDVLASLPPTQTANLPSPAAIDPAFDANSQMTCELERNGKNELIFKVQFMKTKR
jgi:hypothetical protein